MPSEWPYYDDEPLRPEYPPLPPPAVRMTWAVFVIGAAFLFVLVLGLILRALS